MESGVSVTGRFFLALVLVARFVRVVSVGLSGGVEAVASLALEMGIGGSSCDEAGACACWSS